jgi:hypothetical protein
MTPTSPPIIVPQAGGSFSFTIGLHNYAATTQTFSIWTVITLPNYGTVPVLTFPSLTLGAGVNLTRLRNQTVPATAPGGNYIYWGYVGTYPWTITDLDSFTFVKQGTLASGFLGSPADWPCSGEDFISQTASIQPAVYSLEAAYPNPFNPSTTLKCGLAQAGQVTLTIYNLNGQKVATLVDGFREAGAHEITWNAAQMASGIYLCRMQSGNFTAIQKMVLLK